LLRSPAAGLAESQSERLPRLFPAGNYIFQNFEGQLFLIKGASKSKIENLGVSSVDGEKNDISFTTFRAIFFKTSRVKFQNIRASRAKF
jgi:hypothetical protein